MQALQSDAGAYGPCSCAFLTHHPLRHSLLPILDSGVDRLPFSKWVIESQAHVHDNAVIKDAQPSTCDSNTNPESNRETSTLGCELNKKMIHCDLWFLPPNFFLSFPPFLSLFLLPSPSLLSSVTFLPSTS